MLAFGIPAMEVVEIDTDKGVNGIRETEVNPWIARAWIPAPGTHTMPLRLGRILICQWPLQPETLRQALCGFGDERLGPVQVSMLSVAFDMALHDLGEKALGNPALEEISA
jgi:L-alanine-DL-glutamate epimerase-like enolase superfamily enzyme